MTVADDAAAIPAWAFRTILGTAIALEAAAILLAVAPKSAFGPARSAADPLVIHCFLNGLAYYFVWNIHRPGSRWAGLRWLASLLGYGLGMVSLVLAGRAIFDFSPANAELVPLVVPGLVGWVVISLGDYAKKDVPDEVQDEVALAEEEELPVGLVARVQGFLAAFYAFYYVMLMFAFALGTMWYYIVWYAVSEGTVFDPWRILKLLWKALSANASIALVTGVSVAVVVALFAAVQILSGPVKRLWRRCGFDALTAEQQALVDERLRSVWDYANRPGRKAMGWVVWGLGSLIFAAVFGVGVLIVYYTRDIALWLYEAHHEPLTGWHVFWSSTSGLLYVFSGVLLLGWGLWHFIMDRWPGAPEAIATGGLQRGLDGNASSVKSIRRALKRLVRRGPTGHFDARAFLLERRRRFGKGLYIFTAVFTLVAAWGTWASFNSYTLLTPEGIEDNDSFFGQRFVHPYSDVRRVEIECTVDLRGDTQFHWRAVFADGGELNLFRQGELDRSLPDLLRVDTILRGHGTIFLTEFPESGKNSVTDDCLDDVSKDLTDKAGFLRLMHRN